MLTETVKTAHGYLVISYGLRQLGEQEPYFSLTAEEYIPEPVPGESSRTFDGKRHWLTACGCMHDDIIAAAPQLAHLTLWHLSSIDSGPMHYVENAIYHAERMWNLSDWPAKRADMDPKLAFTRHVLLGAVDGDAIPAKPVLSDEQVAAARRRFRAELLDAGAEQGGRRAAAVGIVAMKAQAQRKLAREVITEWCEARKPALIARFHAVLEEAGVID